MNACAPIGIVQPCTMNSSTIDDASFLTQLETVGEAVLISGYLNLCFLVCEVGMLAYGPTGPIRHTLDTMAHILAGPISFLGFLNGGFTGSFFFFLSLWHFLCDSGRARPSYIRERPRTREEFWIWFESLWLLVRKSRPHARGRHSCSLLSQLQPAVSAAACCPSCSLLSQLQVPAAACCPRLTSPLLIASRRQLHHWYIGAYKLLASDLASQLQGIDVSSGSTRFIIRTWVLGATMSHLSFGMSALNLSGHALLRAMSVLFRMGAAAVIVLGSGFRTELRAAYAWDLCWMTVILSLTARKALLSASTPLADREGTAVGGGERPLDRQGGGMATARTASVRVQAEAAIEGRLIQRLKRQASVANEEAAARDRLRSASQVAVLPV